MYLLGYDVGSSSIKASLIDAESGSVLASARFPEIEMEISAPEKGWAEQDPSLWWKNLVKATRWIVDNQTFNKRDIKAIGISYQMHGLVIVDERHQVLRPSIIWCDGRAVDIGRQAYNDLGESYCLEHFMNSPGNFTASKLKWVRDNEPEIYSRIHKFMLPGDFIAMKMTNRIMTTISGLSEGILWDYRDTDLARSLLDYYGIAEGLVPEYRQNFSEQGELTTDAADELNLAPGIPVTYRAGDQPNNALSLNVLDPGDVASTAGTSGVIYGIFDRPVYDTRSRVNTFVHVNHDDGHPSYGILLCVNGTGIQYSWLKNQLFRKMNIDYPELNEMATKVPIGSDGLIVLPFGNGPERSLENRDIGAHISGIDFNRHRPEHIVRAAQEGIAFALNYGLEIMRSIGIPVERLRVAKSNMFLSPVFREAISNSTGTVVELYATDGSIGAAIGAGFGAEIFSTREEAFRGLAKEEIIEPESKLQTFYSEAYNRWRDHLEKF